MFFLRFLCGCVFVHQMFKKHPAMPESSALPGFACARTVFDPQNSPHRLPCVCAWILNNTSLAECVRLFSLKSTTRAQRSAVPLKRGTNPNRGYTGMAPKRHQPNPRPPRAATVLTEGPARPCFFHLSRHQHRLHPCVRYHYQYHRG